MSKATTFDTNGKLLTSQTIERERALYWPTKSWIRHDADRRSRRRMGTVDAERIHKADGIRGHVVKGTRRVDRLARHCTRKALLSVVVHVV
jgi:hypothetical protein